MFRFSDANLEIPLHICTTQLSNFMFCWSEKSSFRTLIRANWLFILHIPQKSNNMILRFKFPQINASLSLNQSKKVEK